jgi:hypothetical protein
MTLPINSGLSLFLRSNHPGLRGRKHGLQLFPERQSPREGAVLCHSFVTTPRRIDKQFKAVRCNFCKHNCSFVVARVVARNPNNVIGEVGIANRSARAENPETLLREA